MPTPNYILHYAPDNASLVVRLALEEIGCGYTTRLVDRRSNAQTSEAFRALNPNGLIPVLETPRGPIFETAAILLWLADQHGGLAPAPESPDRADLLKWLFFMSNNLHPSLRILFYPETYIGGDARHQRQLNTTTQARVLKSLTVLDHRFTKSRKGLLLDIYLAPMLRWLALYPSHSDKSWFNLEDFPALLNTVRNLEQRPSVMTAIRAEGLGNHPFSAPMPAKPPEGSTT